MNCFLHCWVNRQPRLKNNGWCIRPQSFKMVSESLAESTVPFLESMLSIAFPRQKKIDLFTSDLEAIDMRMRLPIRRVNFGGALFPIIVQSASILFAPNFRLV
jgi:hypothetical protein